MAFQTKNFISIVAGMINQLRANTDKITDFTVGSATRTLLEAVAIEIEELYQNLLLSVVEGIPVAAYQAFGFGLDAPSPASGTVTFTLAAAQSAEVFFAAGTRVGSEDGSRIYATLNDVSIPAGQTSVDAGVRALTNGSTGNIEALRIVRILSATAQTAYVSNAAPITNGSDGESPESRRLRFLEFLASISRGPLFSIEYGAKQAKVVDETGAIQERVVSARAVELFRISNQNPLGYVDVYVYNGANGASPALLAEVQKCLDGQRQDSSNPSFIGFKAAGVVCRTHPVSAEPINVRCLIRNHDGFISESQYRQLQAATARVINNTDVGGTLYFSALVAAAKDVAGVVDAIVESPSTDTAFNYTQKPIAGRLVFQYEPI
jgi:uncharacterized phage protein gp47/JayE